jgi:hypothetical protein
MTANFGAYIVNTIQNNTTIQHTIMPSKKQRAKAEKIKAKKAKKTQKEWEYGAKHPEKCSVWCLYKGTTYPHFPMVTQEDWNQLKKTFNEIIKEGVGMNVDLDDQTKMYIGLLDQMESCIHEYATANPDTWGTEDVPEELDMVFKAETGMSLKEGMNVWYMGVYFLIRAGKLQDDNMNGWIVMNTKGQNVVMCSCDPGVLPTNPDWSHEGM